MSKMAMFCGYPPECQFCGGEAKIRLEIKKIETNICEKCLIAFVDSGIQRMHELAETAELPC